VFSVVLTAVLIALSVYHLTRRKLAAGIAMLIYFSSPGIRSLAFRIRPDCYVALFSSLSLLSFLKRRYFLAGLGLGLALGFHPKFLPIELGVLAVVFLLSLKKQASFVPVLLGEFVVLCFIAFWFWYHRALSFLVEGPLGSNFRVAYERLFVEHNLTQLLHSVSRTERLLGFLVVGVLFLLFFKWSRNRKASWNPDWMLSAAFSFCSLLFLFAPVWAHALTFVVPSVIVFLVSALFLWKRPEAVLVSVAVALCAWLSFSNLERLDLGKSLEPDQLWALKLTLKEVKRSEPVFYIWTSRCPAYVFNEDPSREWMNPFRRALGEPIRMLPPIDYLSINPMFLGLLDNDEREYIQKHFKSAGCLWRRRSKLLP
jgi:4-amino-4-deoxy-L-arabinose transferase-like glycosyltransferase